MSTGKLIAALIAGAAAGAATALLFAPDKGENTRRKIGEWSDSFRKRSAENEEEEKQAGKTKQRSTAKSEQGGYSQYSPT